MDDRSHVILSVFTMLISIFSYQLILARFSLRGWQKQAILAVILSTAQVITMSFPLYVRPGVFFDLRDIPAILGVLYGGPAVGLVVSVTFILFRWLSGGSGLVPAFVLYAAAIVLPIWFRSTYQRASRATRMMWATGMISLPTTLTVVGVYFLQPQLFNARFLMHYISVQLFTMSLVTYSLDILLENLHIHEEMGRAERLRMMGNLAASFAHEMRSPMTVIKGFLQLLEEDTLSNQPHPDKQRQYIGLAKSETGRAEEILNQYLALAKSDQRVHEPMDVGATVQYVLDALTPAALTNQVRLVLDKHSDVAVCGDPTRFKQALFNVIKNGIESMPDGGLLQAEVKSVKASAIIAIHDQGVGMEEQEISRIGNPFYSTKATGTGLGLSIAYRAIYDMGGDISVTSSPGSGTCFTISLPYCPIHYPPSLIRRPEHPSTRHHQNI